jgi:hypothetical protein
MSKSQKPAESANVAGAKAPAVNPIGKPTNEPKPDEPKPTSMVGPTERFRRRAWWCAFTALASLFALVALSIGGLIVFADAGAEAKTTNELAAVARAQRHADDEIEALLMIKFHDGEPDAGLASDQAARKVDALDAHRVSQDLEHIPNAASDAHASTEYIASMLSVRIGTALLVIFLAQTFVGVYRYNRRLQAFYDARADALELGGLTPDLIAAVAADAVPFGPEAKAPTVASFLPALAREKPKEDKHHGA